MTDKKPSKTLKELAAELRHDAEQARVRDAHGEQAVKPDVPKPRKGPSL